MSIGANDTPDFLSALSSGTGVPLVKSTQIVAATNTFTFGPFYVGNTPKIYLNVSTGGGQAWIMSLNWLESDAATSANGFNVQWNKTTDTNNSGSLSVMGPWANITAQNIGGANGTVTAYVMAYNAPGLVSDAIGSPVMLNVQNAAIGAGATVNTNLSQNVAGRAHLWAAMNSAAGTMALQHWNGATWDVIAQAGFSVANNNLDLVVPFGDNRISMLNAGAGATNFWAVLVNG